MNLLTNEIIEKFKAHPLYSQEENENPRVLVKYFNPCGIGSWYITEASPQGDDWLMFGLCDLGEPELGYVLLSQLQELRLPAGLTIERDLYFTGSLADAWAEIER